MGINLMGFSYQRFRGVGRVLARLFYSNGRVRLEEALEDAGLKIYPEAYYSLMGFLTVLSAIVVVPVIHLTGFIPLASIPLLVILLGYLIPKVLAYDRASKLDVEVPFAGTYISVMATGGLSPYQSLRKLKGCALLPHVSKAAREIEVDVELKGMDPVTAMERSALHLPSRSYRDLMLGYASATRSGADVIHFLLAQTETMFRNLSAKVRAFGDRAGILMESYIAVIILSTLSLSVIFMTSMAFSEFWAGFFTAENYLLYAYLIVPGLSILFIYLSDASQLQHPISEWGPYKVFLGTLPLTFLLAISMFLPFTSFSTPQLAPPFMRPLTDLVISIRGLLGLERGYEAAIGLALTLIIGTLPAVYAHSHYSKRGKGLEEDITNFLRDLTETRKTGASPEKCIEILSKRSYGRFSGHLRLAARQIRWGLPFKVIYDSFRARIKSWLALINIYLLVDAIEVGGGTPETLETLTEFSEMLISIEKEKAAMLRPLMMMPYMGAGILLASTTVFLGFMRFVLYSFGRQAIPFTQFLVLLLPPLVLQAYLTGLVTGKISSGVLSNGFRHAVVLSAAAIIIMPISSRFSLPFQPWG
ncbi:type II secretion system F family protein [Candidatus Bathyarchaeota archaeon]|nr:type II secretion system F family protein [Candidatus Bathyarchaeota archaeon]